MDYSIMGGGGCFSNQPRCSQSPLPLPPSPESFPALSATSVPAMRIIPAPLTIIHYPPEHSLTGILVLENSLENKLHIFSLDLEKSFSISRSRLKTQD